MHSCPDSWKFYTCQALKKGRNKEETNKWKLQKSTVVGKIQASSPQ